MPIAKIEKHFQKILLVQLLLTIVIHPSCAYMFVGDYHYLDFLSFMKNGSRCGFLPGNISANITKEHSIAGDRCLLFMKEMNNISVRSELTKAQVKYTAFGRTYTFNLKQPPCISAISLQNVEMVLICEGKTVENGITCNSSVVCDREREVCRRYQHIDQQICIPKRHINESCDEYSSCDDENNVCKYSGNTGTCQCIDDHKEMDGRCVKVGLTLGEICYKEKQCSGTKFANKCLHNQTREAQVCSCLKGYIASGFNCIKAGLSLNETCEDDQQCTGTENANKCSRYENQYQPTCRCNQGYVEKQSKCYRINLRLFESCDWSDQCNGDTGANECQVVEGQQICYCPEGKKIFEGICIKVGLNLDDPCYVDRQCTGTPDAGVCTADQINNGVLVCECNRGYFRHNNSCLQGNKTMYEECEIDKQCDETNISGVCKEIGHRKLCLCTNGYVVEEKDLICRKAKAATSWIDEKENKLILIAVGGFFGMIICSISTFLLSLKERIQNIKWFKRGTTTHTPTETIHYSIAENSNIIIIEKAQSEKNNRNDQNENMYDKSNPIEEKETGHLYDFPEPEHYSKVNNFDGTYCHLNKKSLMLCADIYGFQK